LRARHHTILQSACETNHGYVFQIIGDAFCVAFHTAKDGLAAAVEAQRRLQNESWGETPIKVRMGLHSGSAELHENEYRGYLTMAKVQRVMSVAYGGQILLSNASAELMHNELPGEIALHDMKEHRLKGLFEPEHLWQIVAPDLQREFPPLLSLKEIPNNLPVQLTSFIGREKEVEQVKKRLGQYRLVTLTGSGGVGKTRLLIQVASDQLPDYPAGVWLVELAPIRDPELVPQSVCTALDITQKGNTSPLKTLIDYFRGKTILLALDNCEHLIDACAQLSESLLHACPSLQIIASSRESLGIEGENAFRVPSLSLADPTSGLQTIEQSEAVKLFVERASTILPGFALTKVNAPIIAQICRRLDGIALAIELAASRVKLLQVEQIASRLDDTFHLLTGGSRTALPRQQTLRSTIDWSYNLLSSEEQLMLGNLSVFVGGWTLEGAEAVSRNLNVLDLLTHLVDKSLVAVDRERGNEIRYYLLETIRQYAREKLVESGQAEKIRARHLDYYVKFAEEAEPKFLGPEQLQYLSLIELEYDNIRTALEYSNLSGNVELGLQMAWSLMMYWSGRGDWKEVKEFLSKLLAQPQALEKNTLRIKGLIVAGLMATLLNDIGTARSWLDEGIEIARGLGPESKYLYATSLGLLGYSIMGHDLSSAQSYCEEALAVAREIQDLGIIANILDYLGNIYAAQSNYSAAQAASTESMTCFLAMKNRWLSSRPLGNLGTISFQQGDYASACSYWEEALAVYREIRDKANTAYMLGVLANVSHIQGDLRHSAELYEESLIIWRVIGDEFSISQILANLGFVVLKQGKLERAATLFAEGLELNKRIENQTQISICLIGYATMFMARQRPELAAQYLGMAERVTSEIQKVSGSYIHYKTGKLFETVCATMGDEAYTAAYEAGKQMSLDEAVAFALKELGQ
jgi:predicted ATPase